MPHARPRHAATRRSLSFIFPLIATVALAVVTPTGAFAGTTSTWASSIEVPGLGAVNAGNATVNSIACTSRGNCVVGGQYTDASGNQQAFMDNEVNNTWGSAVTVAALDNAGGSAAIQTVACGGVEQCYGVGYYTDSQGNEQGIVVPDDQDVGTALEVTGTINNVDGQGDGLASLNTVACGSSTECTAGGAYTDTTNDLQALVVDSSQGTWADPIAVPGVQALNTNGAAATVSVACPSVGYCTLVGIYSISATQLLPFEDQESNGTWGTAQELPGVAALSPGDVAIPGALSCSSVGNCVVGGDYANSAGATQAFVADEVQGTWEPATPVNGLGSLDAGTSSATRAVSCASDGNCSAGGIQDWAG